MRALPLHTCQMTSRITSFDIEKTNYKVQKILATQVIKRKSNLYQDKFKIHNIQHIDFRLQKQTFSPQ